MPSNEFLEIIEEMKQIHQRKSADYSEDINPFSNFEFTASLIQHFKYPVDQVYVTLIGIKLARLAVLLNSGKPPNNESISDSFMDLANYCVLWGSHYKRDLGQHMKENK